MKHASEHVQVLALLRTNAPSVQSFQHSRVNDVGAGCCELGADRKIERNLDEVSVRPSAGCGPGVPWQGKEFTWGFRVLGF